MHNTDEALAKKAYELINEKASSNILIQGLTGLMGFPFTLIADGAVIFTHYGTLLNEIRSMYGRSPVSEAVVGTIVKGISSELLFDVVADKVLGQVPLIGIYFNAICAKTMTWRLGILFTMLSIWQYFPSTQARCLVVMSIYPMIYILLPQILQRQYTVRFLSRYQNLKYVQRNLWRVGNSNGKRAEIMRC